MDKLDSFVSKYIFQKNDGNEMISATYPMHDFLNKKNRERAIIGGSILIENETGMARFDGLGIPAGLYLEHTTTIVRDITSKKDSTSIPNDLFDKLFNKVAYVKANNKTKKNYHKKTSTQKK
jgi:hypothetical protein